MIKKITLAFIFITLSACSSVKEKVNLKSPLKTCPPAEERTLMDILCKESK